MQVLKDEIRERILDAAKRRFARQRYVDTTIADISEEAEVSVGNIYRYYQNKNELFLAAVPPETASSLEETIIRALAVIEPAQAEMGRRPAGLVRGAIAHGAVSAGISVLTSVDPSVDEKALFSFLCRHTHESVILLERDEGTPYEGLRKRVVEKMTNRFRRQERFSDRQRGLLAPILQDNLIAGIVAVLRTSHTCEKKETALAELVRFYRNGFKTF